MRKAPYSYVVLGGLASAVLFFALRLSSSGRGPVDWVVIGLIALAIAWNVFRLSLRLYRHGGSKAVWHVQRTLLFWIGGLLNTALLRPEHVGSWRNWIGIAILVVAAIDTVALWRKEVSITAEEAPPASAPAD